MKRSRSRRRVRHAGRRAVGGRGAVDRLAERVGSTPFFAYDRGLARPAGRALRAALPADVELSYAVKANPMPAVVQHLARLVDSLDVASAGEMQVALDTGDAARPGELRRPGQDAAPSSRQAVAAGVLVEIESTTEARRVVAVGERARRSARASPCGSTPTSRVKGSGMRMGGGPQQFGVDAERVPALLGELAGADVDWLGFHVFAGSQNLQRRDPLRGAAAGPSSSCCGSPSTRRAPVRYLNLGGGFGIPYFEKDQPLDLDAVGDEPATSSSADRSRPALPEARVVIELGRYPRRRVPAST